MSLPADIAREPTCRHDDMRSLVAMEALFGGGLSKPVADRMVHLLDEDEKEGHPHPPGYVALMEAARKELTG